MGCEKGEIRRIIRDFLTKFLIFPVQLRPFSTAEELSDTIFKLTFARDFGGPFSACMDMFGPANEFFLAL